jgi:hypothetical protein
MGQIWAVARNLIVETLRIRSLVIFVIIVMGILTVGFGFWLHDSSSGLGDQKIQTFLSHSFRFSFNFLSFLTIFISIATISRDIKRREIHTIVTKPISRGQIYLGKFLGVAVLNLILLVFTGVAIYTTTQILVRTEVKTKEERGRLDELVLTARRTLRPTVQGVDEAAIRKKAEQATDEEIRSKREAYGTPEGRLLTKNREATLKKKITEMTNESRSAEYGDPVTFHFSDIRLKDRDRDRVYIRYRQEVSPTPPSLSLFNIWYFGPHPDVLGSEQPFVNRGSIRTVHEFPVPGKKVSESGDLYVTYVSPRENGPTRVIFPLPTRLQKVHGIEALYVAGSFENNFLRTLLSMYMRLMFLGMLGVAAGGYLSFPVGILVVLVIYVMGMSSGFLVEAMNWQLGTARQMTIVSKLIMWMFPQFGNYDPVPAIERGKLVEFSVMGRCLFYMLFIKGGVAAFVGYLLFRFREMARVIV